MITIIKYYYNKILLKLLDLIIIDINYTNTTFAGIEFTHNIYDNIHDFISEEESSYEEYLKLKIKKYKIIYFTNKKKNYDKLRCGICLDKYKIQERITILHCNHKYHYKCIRNWISYGDSCPLCRKLI